MAGRVALLVRRAVLMPTAISYFAATDVGDALSKRVKIKTSHRARRARRGHPDLGHRSRYTRSLEGTEQC